MTPSSFLLALSDIWELEIGGFHLQNGVAEANILVSGGLQCYWASFAGLQSIQPCWPGLFVFVRVTLLVLIFFLDCLVLISIIFFFSSFFFVCKSS